MGSRFEQATEPNVVSEAMIVLKDFVNKAIDAEQLKKFFKEKIKGLPRDFLVGLLSGLKDKELEGFGDAKTIECVRRVLIEAIISAGMHFDQLFSKAEEWFPLDSSFKDGELDSLLQSYPEIFLNSLTFFEYLKERIKNIPLNEEKGTKLRSLSFYQRYKSMLNILFSRRDLSFCYYGPSARFIRDYFELLYNELLNINLSVDDEQLFNQIFESISWTMGLTSHDNELRFMEFWVLNLTVDNIDLMELQIARLLFPQINESGPYYRFWLYVPLAKLANIILASTEEQLDLSYYSLVRKNNSMNVSNRMKLVLWAHSVLKLLGYIPNNESFVLSNNEKAVRVYKQLNSALGPCVLRLRNLVVFDPAGNPHFNPYYNSFGNSTETEQQKQTKSRPPIWPKTLDRKPQTWTRSLRNRRSRGKEEA